MRAGAYKEQLQRRGGSDDDESPAAAAAVPVVVMRKLSCAVVSGTAVARVANRTRSMILIFFFLYSTKIYTKVYRVCIYELVGAV